MINQTAAEEIFETTDVVGKSISLNGKSFLVIGLMAEEESLTSSMKSEVLEAYIPYSTIMRMADNISNVTTFLCLLNQ